MILLSTVYADTNYWVEAASCSKFVVYVLSLHSCSYLSNKKDGVSEARCTYFLWECMLQVPFDGSGKPVTDLSKFYRSPVELGLN